MLTYLPSYVIRLKEIEPSESLSKDCIDSGIRNNLLIEPFDGIFGIDAINSVSKNLKVKPKKEKMKKGRLGVKGCFLSHYLLWLRCLEINNPILICEHDATILAPIDENLIDKFEDILLLDPFNKFSSSYYQNHLRSKQNEQCVVDYSNTKFRKKLGVEKEYPMGLQAYIVKPQAALKLKSEIELSGYLPADVQVNKSVVDLKTLTKPLASINPKYHNNIKLMEEESSTKRSW